SITAPMNSQFSYFVTSPCTSKRRTCSSNAYNNCCPVVAPAYAVRWCCVPPNRLKSSKPSGVRLNITPIRSNKFIIPGAASHIALTGGWFAKNPHRKRYHQNGSKENPLHPLYLLLH